MNIKEAKNEIKNAVRLYLKKEDGVYVYPVESQRPIFLQGAPGVGKTAIMTQIAEEMDIAMVSYSMTHHTRQSALGLPVIREKSFGGMECQVSEYTMSEIIASVYETMEKSGKKEGILFLDEINCVSETLAPSMLLFLQYKIFGSFSLPEGWVVVTAGNPPQYNRSVREFDVVTLDRMRVISVEEDFESWKEYAVGAGVHPAVLLYLDKKKQHFYMVENKAWEKNYVTARGWEDLSVVLRLSEKEGIVVTEHLVFQYLHQEEVAREFFAYYDTFRKLRNKYPVKEITEGNAGEMTKELAKNAPFDERLALVQFLLDELGEKTGVINAKATRLASVAKLLANKNASGDALLRERIKENEERMQQLQAAGVLSLREKKKLVQENEFIEVMLAQRGEEEFAPYINEELSKAQNKVTGMKKMLETVMVFLEEIYGDGSEMLIFVTQLSLNRETAEFLLLFGSEAYDEKSKRLRLSDRGEALRRRTFEM